MNRFFIQISFDGTRYHGWQLQKNAHTVQAELNAAMGTAFRQKIETLGCGRTDTGVHATEFFAHFDCRANPEATELSNMVFKLNSLLPKDIAVQKIFPVKKDASARFDAVSRTYRYKVHFTKDPFLLNRSFYRRLVPDVEPMNEAGRLLLTYNDFSCFSKVHTQVKTNICSIKKARWRKEGSQLVFEIKADRFLRNMVRAIVGTLLEIGDGLISKKDFKKIIESRNRSMAGVSVPAGGLYLTEVKYPSGIFYPNNG